MLHIIDAERRRFIACTNYIIHHTTVRGQNIILINQENVCERIYIRSI